VCNKIKSIKSNNGFTLIEVIIFTIVMGIIGVTILASFNTLLKGMPTPWRQTVANQAAKNCLEWYLQQRYINGFSATTLNCPSTSVPSFCTVPNGYTISTNVACTQLYGDTGSNYKTITVTVGGLANATLAVLLAYY
jgi:type II secretory pathway pseudopilin PulG